jgi:outer membrane protein TolC
MKAKIYLVILGFGSLPFGLAQQTLHNYIQEGLERNIQIKQQHLSIEQRFAALQEAKSFFLPKIVLMTDYFLAGGGRTVDFPAGDLLNPVYSTLNQLTGSSNFPQLQNERILLNPNNFYDVKFRTSMPLLNLDIEYNRKIKRDQVQLENLELEVYRRTLVKDIKVAYFKFLQANEVVKIYDVALDLVNESKRINAVLFANETVNRTALLRADNEVKRFESLREVAVHQTKSAQAYFNFLLNKPLDAAILVDKNYQSEATFLGDASGIDQREELQQMQLAGQINQHVVAMSKSYLVPKLSAFIDLGSQGFDWQFDDKTRYYFFGVSMQWDIFSSGGKLHKTKQTEVQQKIIDAELQYLQAQLQLQFTNAVNSFNAAISSYQSAVASFKSAQQYYTDVLRLYKEGQVIYLELLDAQNQLIQAELQVNISLFETYSCAAEIERANASFNLKN